jgi:hypothetical protein
MLVYIGIRVISGFNMIEIITTSVFVLTSIYGSPTAPAIDNISTTTAPGASVRIEETTTTNIPTSKELEAKAREFFKNDPLLVEIARCESSFRHLTKDGSVLRGKVNKGDVGLMQINEFYHADTAKKLGLDLETLEGNMAYAEYLYNREGGQPWKASSTCWNQAEKSITDSVQVALAK